MWVDVCACGVGCMEGTETYTHTLVYKQAHTHTHTNTTHVYMYVDTHPLSSQIPSHRPVKRIDLPLAMFVNRQIKDRYIQELVIQARLKQQPVLLGTSSVQESEMLNETLRNLYVWVFWVCMCGL